MTTTSVFKSMQARAAAELEAPTSLSDRPVLQDDADALLAPDTTPDTEQESELVEAVEWLKRAGMVGDGRPAFAGFFEEVVNSAEGEHEDD